MKFERFAGLADRRPGGALLALVAGIGIVAAQGAIMFALGRHPICPCGRLDVWHGAVTGPENSQHLTDWYTFSHVIFGLLLYGFVRWRLPRTPFRVRLLVALTIAAGWEAVENSDWVIERFQVATISAEYRGDSIVNSLSDTLAAVLGFVLAWRLPIWVVVALAIVLELGAGAFARDNLTLNVIMLLHPVEAIKQWQAGP